MTLVHDLALPAGVEHFETAGFAATWDAYDALTPDDGWSESHGQAVRCSWKRKTVNGHKIVVHAPTHSRSGDEGMDLLDRLTGEGRR
jgi:hypothetical protein